MARPRSFDKAEAVEAALHIFLTKGYDGSSVADLTTAMRINPASLYAAFGSKRGLFECAMDAYALQRAPLLEQALGQERIADAVGSLVHAYADALTEKSAAPGCLYVHAALSCSSAEPPIKNELTRRRLAIEPQLEKRFLKAKAQGELALAVDCAVMARYVATLLQGMAVQASGGASAEELHALATLVAGQFRASLRAAADDRGRTYRTTAP